MGKAHSGRDEFKKIEVNLMVKKFIISVKYALCGIAAAFREEPHVRFDVFMALLVIICAFLFPLEKWEKCVVFALCGICTGFEIINSAIERAVDLSSPTLHPLAGKAKDMAAGAALVMALFAAIIGLYIFLPYGIKFLNSLF